MGVITRGIEPGISVGTRDFSLITNLRRIMQRIDGCVPDIKIHPVQLEESPGIWRDQPPAGQLSSKYSADNIELL